jgi:hypothetical protein
MREPAVGDVAQRVMAIPQKRFAEPGPAHRWARSHARPWGRSPGGMRSSPL